MNTTLTNDQITAGAAVLAIPTAILHLPCNRTMSHFATVHEMNSYKEGHRDARHAAADLVLARADELKALATPSPQIAEVAELSKAEIDAIVYQCRQQGNDTTYDIVNAAIAASRRAAEGERRITCPSCKGAHSGMGADGVEWDCPKCEDGMVAAPASAGQAASAPPKQDAKAAFKSAFLLWNGFHTDAELEKEWAHGTLAGEMFRAGLAAQPAKGAAGQGGA